MASALLLDADLLANQAGLPMSTRLLYGEEDIRSFLSEELPAAEANVLLDGAEARNPDTGNILLAAAPALGQIGSPAFDAASVVWQRSVAHARRGRSPWPLPSQPR